MFFTIIDFVMVGIATFQGLIALWLIVYGFIVRGRVRELGLSEIARPEQKLKRHGEEVGLEREG